MELTQDETKTLRELEEDLWREETRFNVNRMNEVISADFFEFGRSGRIYARGDSLNIPRLAIAAVLPLSEFKARLLVKDVAQVPYNSAVTHNGNVEYARRSCILSRIPKGWELRFHQGTPFIPRNEHSESITISCAKHFNEFF